MGTLGCCPRTTQIFYFSPRGPAYASSPWRSDRTPIRSGASHPSTQGPTVPVFARPMSLRIAYPPGKRAVYSYRLRDKLGRLKPMFTSAYKQALSLAPVSVLLGLTWPNTIVSLVKNGFRFSLRKEIMSIVTNLAEVTAGTLLAGR